MGKVYAIMIHDHKLKISDVPMFFRNATRKAYFDMYGEDL